VEGVCVEERGTLVAFASLLNDFPVGTPKEESQKKGSVTLFRRGTLRTSSGSSRHLFIRPRLSDREASFDLLYPNRREKMVILGEKNKEKDTRIDFPERKGRSREKKKVVSSFSIEANH